MECRIVKQTVDAGSSIGSVRAPSAILDILVLSGGPSDEREVSLASGRAVHDALARKRHRVRRCDITPDDLSALDAPVDFVFIALHGTFGEDGAVQAILEKRGIPYCGSDSVASALAMNKVASKNRFVERGLPTPPFDVATEERVGPVIARWRTPAVVKPIASGSSVDTYIVRDAGQLRQAVERVVSRNREALIEEYIEGPELTVGILGERALPVCQIRTQREFYNYEAKYIDDETEYLFDIALPEPLLSRVQDLSIKAAQALGCRDFCRVDWMVDHLTHEPLILEINTIPGFTSHSLLPKAAARLGLSFDDLCQRIVALGMKRGQNG
jgi:D-alanine-D-alanine ligase